MTVTPGLFRGGFRGGEGGVTRRGAGGYVAAEAGDVSRGVGGATPGSRVVSIPNFAFGRGKRGTMVANTSEYYVPNYSSGGDAIFNKDMVRTMGLPSGARKINASEGYIPNFNKFQSLERLRGLVKQGGAKGKAAEAELARRQQQSKKIKAINPNTFAMIVPNVTGLNQVKFGKRGSLNEGLSYTVVGFKGKQALKRGVSNDEQLDSATKKYALDKAFSEAKLISGNKPQASKLGKLSNQGAISSLSGAIFETAVSSLLSSRSFDLNRDPNARFDFVGGQGLTKLFKLPTGAQFIEAKIRNSPDMQQSMFGKIRKQLGRAINGYIPNFSDPLGEAIVREKEAGVPINQIRINQSGKLRNAQNPKGLAVTNTRDEPTGRIPNFQREGRGGVFDDGGAALTAIFAAQAIGGLASGFIEAESALGKFVNGITNGVTILATISLLKGPLDSFSKKLIDLGSMASLTGRTESVIGASGNVGTFAAQSRLGKGAAALGRALPGIGIGVSIAAAVAPLVLELTKAKTGFEGLNEQLQSVDLSSLTELGGLENFQNVIQKQIAERATVEATKAEAAKEGVTLEGGSIAEVSAERAENLLKNADLVEKV